jgi:predicted aldo/keto reductase-like oxidoreductase
VVLTSYNFRQPHSAEVRDAIASAASKGLGVIAMKALAGVYWDAERRDPIDAAAALKWVLSDPNVDTCLAGFSNLEQIRVAEDALRNPSLTPADRAALRLGEARGPAGLYCARCGECLGQCPAGVNVPDWMRGYMYAYGYRGRPAPVQNERRRRAAIRPALGPPLGFDIRKRVPISRGY